MLATIREKIQGWFATVILVIIGIPFALWGINSYFEGEGSRPVAEVDGVEIDVSVYRNALERQRQNMRQFLGNNVDARLLDSPAFKTRVVEDLVEQTLLQGYAQEHGFAVADADLARAIRGIPQFQENGKFDPGRYQALLRSNGLSISAFERNMRDDLMAAQIRGGFGQAMVPEADIDRLGALLAERRTISVATLAPKDLLAGINVSPDDIERYYQSHLDDYKVPETVRVAYIELSADQLAAQQTPTEEDIRAFYNEEAARFVTPEQRRASHILITVPADATPAQAEEALKKAQGIRAAVVAGEDFAAAARKHSQDPVSAAKGGDLGFSGRDAFVKEFEAALYSLKKGEISAPVKTQYGYHIIKLVDLKPEIRKPFAEVRAELEKTLRQRQAEERFFELSQTLQNALYEHPDSLEPAAKAMGLKIQHSDWFGRQGGPGIAQHRPVVDAAFAPEVLAQQRNSDAIEVAPTRFVAVRVTEKQPARERPLAEVQAQVTAAVKQERAGQVAQQRGAALLAELQKGTDLKSAAKTQGATLSPATEIGRQERGALPAQVVAAAFKAPRPGDRPTYTGVDLGAGGYAVVVISAVKTVAPDKAQARQILEQHDAQDRYTQMLAHLRETKKVKIYSDRL